MIDRRTLILVAASVAVGIVAVAIANWLVFTAMVLSVVGQLVNVWLRWRHRHR